MTAPRHVQLRRHDAILAARARFEGKPLVWGQADCARLAAFTAGHQGAKPALSKFGRYHSAATALRRLTERGHADLPAALDAITGLQRLEIPAFAMRGDLVAMQSADDRMPALGVYLGGDKYFGFDPEPPHVCRVLQMLAPPLIVWSVRHALNPRIKSEEAAPARSSSPKGDSATPRGQT